MLGSPLACIHPGHLTVLHVICDVVGSTPEAFDPPMSPR